MMMSQKDKVQSSELQFLPNEMELSVLNIIYVGHFIICTS